MRLFLITLCLAVAASAMQTDFLRVKLNHGGGVVGKYMTTKNGRGIVGFTGIPYAEMPIGDLRWKDTVMKKGWNGWIDGTRNEHVVCPQYNTWNGKDNMWMGQEDCLYMNVYVPMTLKDNKHDWKNLPVMFYLHGGGYTMGNGNVDFAGPDYLLDNDVILVTGNYRLGAFGFMTTGNTDMDKFRGNMGLKDQVMMMKWIQDNIQHFGGDRNKVTIFGDGAGAASIGFHMMSNGSKGLFHQAIMQGGTQYNQWALQDKQVAVNNAIRMINELGCNWNGNNNVNDMNVLNMCLMKKNTHDVMRVAQNMYDWHNDPMVTFGPVVDNHFLTKDIYTTKDYWGNQIPTIVGFNNDAGAFKWITLLNDKNLMKDMTTNFDDIMQHMFHFKHNDQQTKMKINTMLRDFYFKNKDWNNVKDIQQGFIDMVTDGWFLSGIDEFLYNRLNNNKGNNGNTFVFVFNYRGDGSKTDYMLKKMVNGDLGKVYNDWNNMDMTDRDYNDKFNFGVSNNDNMMYLFPWTKNVMNHRVMNWNDNRMVDMLTKMWFNFAAYGTPNCKDNNCKWNWNKDMKDMKDMDMNMNWKWTNANKYPVDWMRIGNWNNMDKDNWLMMKNNFGSGNDMWTCGMQNGLFDDRVNLWRQINTIRNMNTNNYNKWLKNEL